jgi:hypothetical protein
MRGRWLVVVVVLALWSAGSMPAGDASAQEQSLEAAVELLDVPQRLVDTRGSDERTPGSTLQLEVAGRGGIPAGAFAAILNVTVVSSGRGFVTVHPCGTARPIASNLNHTAGQTIAAAVVTRLADDGTACLYTHGATHLVVDVTGHLAEAGFDALPSGRRLLDTRAGGETYDGEFAATGRRDARSELQVQVAGRAGLPTEVAVAVLTVTAVDAGQPGFVTAYPCGTARPNASHLNHAGGQTVANTVLTRTDEQGRVCLYTHGATDLVVDVAGTLPAGVLSPLDVPRRVLDTRRGMDTADGDDAGGGLRPARATLRLDVGGRVDVPPDAGAVVLNVTVDDARDAGFVTVHASGTDRPNASNVNYVPGQTVANMVVARLGADGRTCLFTHGATHLVVDVIGWLPGPEATEPEGSCPAPPLFPTYRMVGLYGNDASSALGALGEQSPSAAADRLERVMQPWRAGDRPVLGVFELIATIATAAPGSDGMYRTVSSAAHVQRYLDAAREHGFHLLLDIQPGRSDFLTETQRYERFIREPDVGIALDPEWRVGPGQVPGQVVGQVTAAEVNQVAEYLAGIVREEGLPQKLLVVHQFQDRMIVNRDQLIAPPELAVNIHMDGFGTRQQKLTTYGITQVEAPFTNGFKLFYDEDVNMFAPSDVLNLDPVPDLITYQ